MSSEQANKADERFDKMVTMLIASVAILVAVSAYFQNYAGNISDRARRRAQEQAIAATKKEVNGAIQFSYQWQGAFQTWKELGLQVTAAQQDGDTARADRYTQLQDRIAVLSPMLGPDYFDPAMGWPDTYKYEADSYLVESTRLTELYLAEAELGRVTDAIADSLIVQITLLTVALSLYGLSITLKGRVRWLFILVGSGIVGICILWLVGALLGLFIRPEVNTAAIDAYAEGVGLSYQGRYDEAILKFDEAIAQNEFYAKPYYDRGSAYFYKNDLASAIRDYEAARYQGLDDTSINWNLGWTYYLAGQYPEALEADERVLNEDPSVMGVSMNKALAHLAAGDLTSAQAQYDDAISEAERQVSEARANGQQPSASLWYYMDAGALDLQNLVDTLDNKTHWWTQAPPADLITGDHAAVRDFAQTQMTRIKEALVALEYTGSLPAVQDVMQVEPFIFGQITAVNDQGLITEFETSRDAVFPYGTESVTVEFTYSGHAPESMVWKIYLEGTESQSLRSISTDDISGGSTWYRTFGYDYTNVFILSPGEYVVELYADSRLVQRGTFIVEDGP
jgi:tetratricopeptide (TPR) repeat protein